MDVDDMLLLSVIVPVYNVEKYLDRCVASICGQTYRAIEVILVDDGSGDGSGRICDEWAKKDARVRVLHVENGGVSRARNLGMEAARGDYICFVDSDDWLDLDYFAAAVPVLEKERPKLLLNNYVIDDGNGNVVCKFPQTAEVFRMGAEEAFFQMATGSHFGWEPFASFYEANDSLKTKFPTDIAYGEDLLFRFRFTKAYPGLYVYQWLPKYHYFTRPDSAVNSYAVHRKADDLRVLEAVMAETEARTRSLLLGKEYAPRLVNRYLEGTRSADERDRAAARQAREKISRHFFAILRCPEAIFTIKLKSCVCLLPTSLALLADAVYKRIKKAAAG